MELTSYSSDNKDMWTCKLLAVRFLIWIEHRYQNSELENHRVDKFLQDPYPPVFSFHYGWNLKIRFVRKLIKMFYEVFISELQDFYGKRK